MSLHIEPRALSLTLPTEFAAIDSASHHVRTFLDRHDRSGIAFSVCLGLREALNNAMEHGNGMQPEKRVHVQLRLTPTLLVLEVEDEGAGFTPPPAPEPGSIAERGRGLAIMAAYFTRLSIPPPGNRLTLELRIS